MERRYVVTRETFENELYWGVWDKCAGEMASLFYLDVKEPEYLAQALNKDFLNHLQLGEES